MSKQTEAASEPPLTLRESTPLAAPFKVWVLLAGGLFALVMAWATLLADMKASARAVFLQDRRIESLETKFEAQREILNEIRSDVKLLNRSSKP